MEHDILQVDVDLGVLRLPKRVEHLALVDDGSSDALHLAVEAAGPRIAL